MLYKFIYELTQKKINNNEFENTLPPKDSKNLLSRREINKTLNRFIIQYLWSKNKIHLHCYKFLSNYLSKSTNYSIIDLKEFISKEESEHINEEILKKEIRMETKEIYETLIYFKNKGFSVDVDEGIISNKLINNVYLYIEALIKKHGRFFTEMLLKKLEMYKMEYNLYYINIHKEYFSKNSIYPYGLLLMLGLKHYNNYSLDLTSIKKDYDLIMVMSSHLVNLLDLHFYGQHFELIFSDRENFIKETQRLALLDSIFRFNQYNPNHVLWLIEKIIEKVNLSKEQFDFNTKKTINIIYDIFKYTYESNKNLFNLSELITSLNKYEKDKVINILIKISHVNNCNNNYKNPYNDLDKLDYYNKPLIINYIGRLEGNCNIILSIPDYSIFSIGFYNCIVELLRNEDKDIDSEIGKWMENIIAEKLREINLNVIGPNKTYKLTKNQKNNLNLSSDSLETDLIIEFDDRIAFIEIKKKTLRKKSKSGEYFSILDDLSKSLINSQTQSYRHERFLQNNKEINFTDGTRIKLDNRDIITISLSIFNYGSLHDFSFTSKALEILSESSLTDENHDKKDIDKLNKSLRNLHNEVNLKSYEYSHMKFNKCHFLNIFHLLYLIDLCKSKNLDPSYIFKKAMDNKRINTNAFDFYYEFSYLLSLDSDMHKYRVN